MACKKHLIVMCSVLCSTIGFSQNVGIGTAAPGDKLTVHTAGSNFGITHTNGFIRLSTFLGGFGDGAWVGTTTNNPLYFYTVNSLPHMTIATNGNVGVGVTNPAYKLDISNRIRIRSQGTNGVTAGIWFSNYDNTADEGFIGEVGPGIPNHIGMYGSGTGWQLVMNTVTGNVGIGTFMTGAGNGKLNIASPGNAIKLHGGGQYISFYDAGNNYKGYMWNPGNNIEIGTDVTNTFGEVNLKIKGVQGLSVQSDGRVRVGDLACTSPFYIWDQGHNGQAKLSVVGHIGLKKSNGDRIGEWVISYSGPSQSDALVFHYNGGGKAWVGEFDGGWNTYSDIRLKEELEDYKPVLDGIKNINVLTYHYKASKPGARNFGLIAQNVKQYFPEIVSGSEETFLGIDYSKTGVLAIKAIQEQQHIIDSQQKKIEELEKRLERLERNK